MIDSAVIDWSSGQSGGELPPYLRVLNPEQLEATLYPGKSLLILAGAGSGKTRVITSRIAYLVKERGADPRSILAVTFTNKAAREMEYRARLIDIRAGEAMLRTFHSFGAWFLRRNGALAGLDSNFIIYDEDDTISLLGSLLEGQSRMELRSLAFNISRAKDYCLGPEDPALDEIDYHPGFREIYARYEERLSRIGNVDFGDLIKKPVEILRGNPDVARRFQDRFRYILVDEYQDSNIAQAELLRELVGEDTHVCAVGDDDQSIYRFRGAEVRNILEFQERFPGSDRISLERNYRSTGAILAVAQAVVSCNRGRLGKSLKSERGAGKKPALVFLPDQDAEAAFCGELIEKSREGGGAYGDWAILYRTNAQSMGFEAEFVRRGIPYRVVGSLKFYEREEIKDSLAALALLSNPRDEVAFRRVVNKPARGIGAATLDRILAGRFAGETILDIPQAAREVLPKLSAKARLGLTGFLGILDSCLTLLGPVSGEAASGEAAEVLDEVLAAEEEAPEGRESLRAGEGLAIVVRKLVQDSGLAEYHFSHDEVAGNQRLANLQELINAASIYSLSREGLTEFLEHIELDRTHAEERDSGDEVTLITLHNTKGLEFRRVIITGNEQGVFPREDKRDEELEEERRLFYVGATRAMDELYLTSCGIRRMFGRVMPMEPSLFLREAASSPLRILGKVPPGFALGRSRGGAGPQAGWKIIPPAGGAAKQSGKVSSDGRWTLGDRVYHDDHGYGWVEEIREDDEEGPIVKVTFETQREIRFLSRSQSGNFMKVGAD